MKTTESKQDVKQVYTLIPIEDFKSVLGIDDRDDALCKFCLTTAAYTIEQYCRRRLLRKKHFERIEYIGDLFLPLLEYPVKEVLAVYVENSHPCEFSTRSFSIGKTPAKALETATSMSPKAMGNYEILEPDFYSIVPDCGTNDDIPFHLSFSRALQRYQGLVAVKVIYSAGYAPGNVPPDLASACLELAAWNMNRYRGKRIGMTGNIRGTGKDGEHFELSMPENVRSLLETYRRKTI